MNRKTSATLGGLFGAAVGVVGGYLLSVQIGFWLWPGSNLAPLPMLLCAWPLFILIATTLGASIGWRVGRD